MFFEGSFWSFSVWFAGDSEKSKLISSGQLQIQAQDVSSQVPSQPPPTSEFGVVGSDPGAVQYISLCLQYLEELSEKVSSLT